MKRLAALKERLTAHCVRLIRRLTFGLKIDRNTDIIALAAFLIALGGILFQMSAYFRGPVIRPFPPSQITIRPETFPNGQEYVTFVAPMAYVNVGYRDHHGTVKSERLHFQLGGRTYEQAWHRFVHTDAKGTELVETVRGPARPLPVTAGSSTSHETVFLPQLTRCRPGQIGCDPNAHYLLWKEFLGKLVDLKQLKLQFITEIYNKRSVETACFVDIDPTLRIQLIDQKWAGTRCWENP